MYFFNISGDSNAQIDHMLRSINCSVQKSIDVNGSDLPLSGNCANYFYIHNLIMNFINNLFCIPVDPFTLRFFYNLGLEVRINCYKLIRSYIFIYFKLFCSIFVAVLIGII